MNKLSGDGSLRAYNAEKFIDARSLTVPPSGIICSRGRTAEEFEKQGTGTGLYLQMGTPSEVDHIPMAETDLAQTSWTEGACFYVMGECLVTRHFPMTDLMTEVRSFL